MIFAVSVSHDLTSLLRSQALEQSFDLNKLILLSLAQVKQLLSPTGGGIHGLEVGEVFSQPSESFNILGTS